MSDDDIDFELVTNASQLAPPPPLVKERVILYGWKTVNGKVPAFLVWELTALEFGEYQESLRIYKDGSLEGATLRHDDLKYLSFTCRDANGNRLWHSTDAAIAQLGVYGKSAIQQLVSASNRVNNNDQSSAEGNSEAAPTDSSPSISPSS